MADINPKHANTSNKHNGAAQLAAELAPMQQENMPPPPSLSTKSSTYDVDALRLISKHLSSIPDGASNQVQILLDKIKLLDHPLSLEFKRCVQAGELDKANCLLDDLIKLLVGHIAGKQEQDQEQPLKQQQEQQHHLDLIPSPAQQIKPSRSLSIIIGDRDHHHLYEDDGGGVGDKEKNHINGGAASSRNSRSSRGGPGAVGKFGHKLHTQFSMPCSLNARRNTHQTSTYQVSHSLLDERIIFCQLSLVNKKDFAEEVRALLDVRKFVADSFILTDVSEVRIPDIVGSIVDRLVECRQLDCAVGEEARSQLFVERDSLSMVLANTMQGLYKSRTDGRLAYDHSWVVATASLAGLTKRQVAIARLPHPVNFGRQSQEVRFLVIVLAPSKEKLTKSAWETGRTFATMFTDIEFRRRMLKAKSQEEMKVEMLVRAETLAREHEHNQSGSSEGDDETDNNWYNNKQVDQNNITCRHYSRSVAATPSCCEDKKQQITPGAKQKAVFCTTNVGSLEDSFEKFDQKLVRSRYFCKTNSQSSSGSATSSAGTSIASGKQITGGGGGGGGGGAGRAEPRHRAANYHTRRHRRTARTSAAEREEPPKPAAGLCGTQLGAGLADDLKRRASWYLSDFTDGLLGERSLYKTISTTIFLYFSVLLPCIAFGVVDTNNTEGAIDPKKTMIGQALGGLFFALFSGQPLVVIMTTAPLCIYVKVIYQISQDLEVDFGSFYACTGLWMAGFLVIFALTNSSNFMKHCTRSTEDIFAIFTAFAFGSDGVREAIRSFQKYYWEADCGVHQIQQHVLVSRATVAGGDGAMPTNLTTRHHAYLASSSPMHAPHGGAPAHTIDSHESLLGAHHELLVVGGNLTGGNGGVASAPTGSGGGVGGGGGGGGGNLHVGDSAAEAAFALASQSIRCQRETCILFLFLMCGTLWLANSFNSFDRTPYLSTRKREIIKDYALAIAVLIFSFVGSCLFADVKLDVFEFGEFTGLHLANLSHLSSGALATSCLLGFMAAVLFYIDQNICGAMVNNAPYKLKKGNYFHLDLLVLAILNAFLSLTGLPWMHGKLPHSHLHSKALADYEERVDEGHIHQTIVNIRETRMTGLLVSLLIALSLFAVPYPLSYIPLPVLSGVFLYTALAEFKSNSMVERICLLFTEQTAYPPNHYIRRCPQRKIHLFTLAQIIQLAIVSFIGFYPNPYVNMAFPLAVATFVPVREILLPKLIDTKYLHSLDTASLD